MNIIKKLLTGTGKEILDSAGGVIDTIATNDEEKLSAKNRLTEIVTKALNELSLAQAKVLEIELSGNKLQRNWRPAVMVTFAFIITYRYFFSLVFGFPAIELPDQFWDLLEIGLGGYVIGRSLEKVTDKVTSNIDMTFLKKKDRANGN